MFEGRRRGSKLKGVLHTLVKIVIAIQKASDKSITAPYAIHDVMNVVGSGFVKLLAVPSFSLQLVVGSTDGVTFGVKDQLNVGIPFHDLF